MRKNQLLAIVMILGVIFMALPAYADYNQTSTWSNQLDNTRNAPNFTAIGNLKDENPQFGSGTIVIPFNINSQTWDTPGCNPNVVEKNGTAINSGYNCVPNDQNQAFEPKVNIQDLFQGVVEGSVAKLGGAQGISQYLDSLFSMPGANGTDGLGHLANQLYIDQTLDQDLADLTHDSNTKGIWQRLHSAVDIYGQGNGATGGAPTEAKGMDQTVEAFVSDRHPAGTAPGLLGKDLGNTVTVYLGQWFQGGDNLHCGGPASSTTIDPAMCSHTEFGGHGSAIKASAYTPATGLHDP